MSDQSPPADPSSSLPRRAGPVRRSGRPGQPASTRPHPGPVGAPPPPSAAPISSAGVAGYPRRAGRVALARYHQDRHTHGPDPSDALVTPPGAGLGGWFTRCRARSAGAGGCWCRSAAHPGAAGGRAVGTRAGRRPFGTLGGHGRRRHRRLPATFAVDLSTVLGVLVGGSLIFGLVQCVGWAAGTWVIARQAAGEPADLGAALRYGLRRALGLWGWTLIVALLVRGRVLLLPAARRLRGVRARHGRPGVPVRAAGPDRPVVSDVPRPPRAAARPGGAGGRVPWSACASWCAGACVESAAILPFGATPLDAPGTRWALAVIGGGAAGAAGPPRPTGRTGRHVRRAAGPRGPGEQRATGGRTRLSRR